MFRVSRVMYNEIRYILCAADPFFRDGFDARKKKKISVDAPILVKVYKSS